jgi:hypothetical protein
MTFKEWERSTKMNESAEGEYKLRVKKNMKERRKYFFNPINAQMCDVYSHFMPLKSAIIG